MPDLSDAQVRTAWKDIAAETHPDRPGGGDITDYTAAATAYAQLRTRLGTVRGLRRPRRRPSPHVPVPGSPVSRPTGLADLGRRLLLVPARIRHGRPLRLAARALAAALLSLLVLALIPGQASGPAVVTGLVIWFFFTARADLAPPPGR